MTLSGTHGSFQGWRTRLAVRTRLRRWWRRRDPKRRGLPRLLVNGFPKSGTHLLRRTIDLLPGMASDNVWLPPRLAVLGGKGAVLAEAERLFKSIQPGEYAVGHVRYGREMAELLERQGFRAILILRDPRDVAVSWAIHIAARPEHKYHQHFTDVLQTDEERLMASIVGVQVVGRRPLANIGRRLQNYLPWLHVTYNFTTRFERLVGPQGGGRAEDQLVEIEGIARHLGMNLSSEQIAGMASRLFGQGATFRQGRIGSWKERFNEEHKAAFKRVAGEQLVELGYEPDLDW